MTGTNVADSDTADIANALGRLSLDEKVTLLTGASAFTLHENDTIGLAAMSFSDGPTGVRGLKFSGGNVVCLFPNATVLASSWRAESLAEVGTMLAEEAMRQQIHVVLGPTINLHRSPLGGRLFEAYSEDPLLTGVLAAAYVKGLQARGIGACLKHLVANESETDRNSVNSVVDETTLRELYLLPFEIAVADADPWSVMAAYNDVNGVPATEHNHVNNEILKQAWGWTGLLMSDWFATKSAAPAANGGLDLVMPGPSGPWGDALVAAVSAGEVDEAVIDDHLTRLLRLAGRVGAFGGAASAASGSRRREWPTDLPAPDSAIRREQLTRLAAEGMTVVVNSDDTLPLNREASIALIGRHAVETIGMGGGSAQVNPPYQVGIADGLARLVDNVTITDGVEVRTRARAAGSTKGATAITDPVDGTPGARLTYYDADGVQLDDLHSATAFALVGFDDDYPRPVARVRMRAKVDPVSASSFRVGAIGVAQWSLTVNEMITEHTLTLSGADPGEALLRPPSWTFDTADIGDGLIEATMTLAGTPFGVGGLVAGATPRPDRDSIADAVEAAGRADVAVVVVGLTEEDETEAADKSTLRLPGAQDALVSAVAAAARKTVVVINAATPVLMPWLDDVDAVLIVGLPGQEAGHAVAAALVGAIEPAGRLVTSYPSADGAAPAWDVVPTDGRLTYAEGTSIGYRGHDRAPDGPLFWFGHGLGYSTWEYGATAEVMAAAGDSPPTVRVSVRNTGTRDSREVVQAYFRPAESDQPIRLVGWTVVDVPAGASAEVDVVCDERMWRRWDTIADDWTRLAPGGELVIARGLGDVRVLVPLRD